MGKIGTTNFVYAQCNYCQQQQQMVLFLYTKCTNIGIPNQENCILLSQFLPTIILVERVKVLGNIVKS